MATPATPSAPATEIPTGLDTEGLTDQQLLDSHPDDFDFLKDDFSAEERSELDVVLAEEEEMKSLPGEEEEEDEIIAEEEEPIIEAEEEEEEPEVEGEEAPLEEGEEEEDALYYDPARDFPDVDNAAPNVFKDKISANLGLVSKGAYMEKLIAELAELGKDAGAIPLPDVLEGDEGTIADRYSVNNISALDDEATKLALLQSDQFINSLKGKLDREKTALDTSTAIQQNKEVIDNASKEMDLILRKFGYTEQEIAAIDNDKDVFSRIDSRITEMESNADDLIAEKGYAPFSQEMKDLTASRQKLEVLVEDVKSALENEPKPEAAKAELTPEQVESALTEFESDQPDNWVFKDKTGNTLEALIRTAKTSGWKQGTPRDWARNAQEFKKIVQSMHVKKEAATVKPGNAGRKPQGTAIKPTAPKVSATRREGERIDNFLDRDLDNFMESELFED